MSAFLSKIIAFFMSVISFFSGLFGFQKPVEPPAEPGSSAVLFERYALPPFGSDEQADFFEAADGTVIGRYENRTEADLEAYVSALKKAGFELYDENTIENNRFATLLKDKTEVTVSFYPGTAVLRIIAEPAGGLCPLTDDPSGAYPTLLTGMKGETVVAAEGMGFIIRLADGSFCIIDGGMGDPDGVDADKLMNILLEQKPADVQKPVIAAWIFTHLHGDHIGVFNCFSLAHHDDVVLERLYFNFPKDEETAQSDSPYMLDDTIYRYTQFRKNLAEFYEDVPVVKLHSGNRFAVRNSRFEVLYAYDDLYPLTILDGGMNECSLLLKMTVNGQTVLWTGDIASHAVELVLDEYDTELSSDILQMAHHGLNGSVAFYSAVDPEVALLPVWEGGLPMMLEYPQNQWLVNSDKMRQMIVTSCGTWTIPLPYSPVEGTFDRIPTASTVYPSYPVLLGTDR